MIKKCFKMIIPFVAGMAIGMILTTKKVNKALKLFRVNAKKEQLLCTMLHEWILIKIKKKRISDYLKQNGYSAIAIYGMNMIGELLVDELNDSDIEIKYGIDKRAEYIDAEIDMLKPDSELPDIDAVVVTAAAYFDEIKLSRASKLDCPILSLETILHELL